VSRTIVPTILLEERDAQLLAMRLDDASATTQRSALDGSARHNRLERGWGLQVE
jgi:hypothetical protein